jgi:myo-inositol-1(or 4)-monophosphatase
MIDVATAAGEGLKQDFLKFATLEISHKLNLADPVSAADLRAEQIIRERLSAAFPDYGFLGEEGGLTSGRDSGNVFVVDPLDGTANFLCGIPLFAVNIALVRDGEVIAGVTHVPMLDETFWAEKGGGAWLNGRQIRVSDRREMIHAILGVGIPFAGKPRHRQFLVEMERLTERISGIRRLGAGAIDMVYVACGRFDAYWEQSVSPWDMAAGVIIVEEAGGVVTDTLGRKLDIHGGTVLASTPQLQAQVLAAIAPGD